MKLQIVTVLSLASLCLAQQYYSNEKVQQQQEPYYKNPPPQIISHKQAQNHDGNFKYAFASENGHVQGEFIAPDGSRNGGYTYVDPSGKKISVKYTAGKEGFKIIEGDHIPTPPPHAAAVPVVNSNSISQNYDDGQYRPELYENDKSYSHNPAPVPITKQQIDYSHNQPHYQAPIQRPVEQQQLHQHNFNGRQIQDFHDEPGQANTFGTGYSFAFGG